MYLIESGGTIHTKADTMVVDSVNGTTVTSRNQLLDLIYAL